MFEKIRKKFTSKENYIKIKAYNNLDTYEFIEFKNAKVDKFWTIKGSSTPNTIEFYCDEKHYILGNAYKLNLVYKYWTRYDNVEFSIILEIKNLKYNESDKSYHGIINSIKGKLIKT